MRDGGSQRRQDARKYLIGQKSQNANKKDAKDLRLWRLRKREGEPGLGEEAVDEADRYCIRSVLSVQVICALPDSKSRMIMGIRGQVATGSDNQSRDHAANARTCNGYPPASWTHNPPLVRLVRACQNG